MVAKIKKKRKPADSTSRKRGRVATSASSDAAKDVFTSTPEEIEGRAYRRPSSDDKAHMRHVDDLLHKLSNLARDSDPEYGKLSADHKDFKAYNALLLAAALVDAVAGWALRHEVGLGFAGKSFLPLATLPIQDTSEYRRARKDVDRHEHEAIGSLIYSGFHTTVISPATSRQMLTNLILPLEAIIPPDLHRQIVRGLECLSYGETTPIFQPERKGAKRGLAELELQLRAIEHVEFRTRSGKLKRYKAQERVAAAFNVSPETIRTWETRLPAQVGTLKVKEAISIARSFARMASLPNLAEASKMHYGDEALKHDAREYEVVQRSKK
jgi:hypothetical protein